MTKTALFGPFVRSEAYTDSDIDLIVGFPRPKGFLPPQKRHT